MRTLWKAAVGRPVDAAYLLLLCALVLLTEWLLPEGKSLLDDDPEVG